MPKHLRISGAPPVSLEELKQSIATRRITFPLRVERVARKVLAEPELMAFESASQIARSIGVSTSTVMRFVTHIGFRNIDHARRIFQAELRRRLIYGRQGHLLG